MGKTFESRHKLLGLPPEKGIDLSVSGPFRAVYELDKDKVEVILRSGKVDINSNWCFGQTSVSERPDEHMLESFSTAHSSKVTCQLFEKIDNEAKAINIFLLLQVTLF